MKGYEVFEERHLHAHGDEGIAPNETRIGFLDFLRELADNGEGIPSLTAFTVTGFDEVLYFVGSTEITVVSLSIHRILQSAAKSLEQKKVEVQIACKGKLEKADSFWLEYRGEQYPLDPIFGTPSKKEIHGAPVFCLSFNLSS